MPKIVDIDEFIQRSRRLHLSTYDYSGIDWKGVLFPVKIKCLEHGIFEQRPDSHMRGRGCPKCGKRIASGKHRLTTEQIVRRAMEVHGNHYDYSKMKPGGSRALVTIVCPQHGEFKQRVYAHLSGQGCPSCGRIKLSTILSHNLAKFVQAANLKHGDKYNYERIVVYRNNRDEVSIICPLHGPFVQRAANHLRGDGCPECAGKKPVDREEFTRRSKEKHGDFYDYKNTQYRGFKEKISIVCPLHGSFVQRPCDHVAGRGCRHCGRRNQSAKRTLTWDQAVSAARQAQPASKYEYIKPDSYSGLRQKISIRCLKHNQIFSQTLDSHIHAKAGCPRCGCTLSKAEDELFAWVQSICQDVLQRDRRIIKPCELDIVVPSRHIAIEYNGMYFHCCAPGELSNANKDAAKSLACAKAGYQLFIVWEHDWKTKQEVIKHWLQHKLGKASRLCGARQAEIGVPSNAEASQFYTQYHLQGKCQPSKTHLGLRFNGNWVAMLTFTKSPERNIKLGDGEFYFARLAFAGSVPGGASKLFKAAVTRFNVTKVVAHSDNSYADGDVKAKLNFTKVGQLRPRFRVWHPSFGLKHRTFWQKCKISQRIKDLGLSVTFNPFSQTTKDGHRLCGCNYAWDCGKTIWVWAAPSMVI